MKQDRRDRTECLYRYPDGGGCAIGVHLTDETIQNISENHDNNSPVCELRNCCYVEYDCNEAEDIQELQFLHDKCMTDDEERFKEYRKDFILFLEQLKQCYITNPS